MRETEKKYIRMYLGHNVRMICCLFLPIVCLLLIVALIGPTSKSSDVLLCFLPVAFGGVWLLVNVLYILRFLRIIKLQEEKFGIEFEDKNSILINRKRLIFISEDWLICAGECAFYREYVKSFSVKKINGTGTVGGYTIIVNTVDGKKYRFGTDSNGDIKKFREWRTQDNASLV